MEALSHFLQRFESYGSLSAASKAALEAILVPRTYRRNDYFIREGQHPKNIAFVCRGLFSQYFTAANGDVVIKRFFPEGYFCTSMSAVLSGAPSDFTIQALEDSSVLEYSYGALKRLTKTHADIADAYIRYLEVHWVIEKEPQEISLRYETAKSRYLTFLQQYPSLEGRLKQHQIAAFLGVTPTQLSRIRAEL
ncbi:MAG TPA: Crp/Fnr family transcriptional regulator [Chitinophagaceae bacterium]|jgi:CRP-like cAMP-binding protein|nr:Crp/Fnr family transcriptional regulator [Chitinophagaceae bacterium]